jgi:endoglucanase
MRRLISAALVGVLAVVPAPAPASADGTVTAVVVSQAGYSAGGYKTAYVLATDGLTDVSFQVRSGSTVVGSGTLVDEGTTWGKRVYSADFSGVTATGPLTVASNGTSSHPFPVSANVWSGYTDEMTAFYRVQRASVATADVYPAGYSSVAPSPKVFHPAGHLDDAKLDGVSYDLTGGWYDAGDYGKYGGNQWVGGEIALAYLRHAAAPEVRFDRDGNGVPDLVDEAVWGGEYLVKFADQLGGALYNIPNKGGFLHPQKLTDNVPGTADDRVMNNLSVGGSAKAAGTLAATARAVDSAIAAGHVAATAVPALSAFSADARAAALVTYGYAAAHPEGPEGSYVTVGGIPNAMLWAEVQLFLLTGEASYRTSAAARISTLTFDDLRSTNYWDLRPISMAELYPVADATTRSKIQTLLRQQAQFFLSSVDDTPYGVLNQFKNFGVNEPHASYLGDMVRYYELFGDPAVLRAVLKGTYWIFGANPWNTSWVSGIGADHVDYLHTRLDEASYDQASTGVVIPGAMVSGPNARDPKDRRSASPWYADRPLWQDDTQQWRYNEFSVSIQAGLLYTVMGLARLNAASTTGGAVPTRLPVTTPATGRFVTGSVTVLAQPAGPVTDVRQNPDGTWRPMTLTDGSYRGTFSVDGVAPYTNRRVDVRAKDAAGRWTYSSTHYTVAPPLPTPATPLLYDDFNGAGLWGGGGQGWVNWYNEHAGTGAYERATVDGRAVGRFSQNPASSMSRAKFEPWKDTVDLRGFRYLQLTMRSPSPDARIRVDVSDGTRNAQLTGGAVAVSDTWTTYRYDLDAHPLLDRSRLHLVFWLSQAGGQPGQILVDDISGVNVASGTAPTLTAPASDGSTFEVTYADADNQRPFTVDAVIDGVIHPMTSADGSRFTLTTRLPTGRHQYWFRTTDTTSGQVRTATFTVVT